MYICMWLNSQRLCTSVCDLMIEHGIAEGNVL